MQDIKINWQPTNLENELVKLKPMVASDFDAIYAVASDPNIWAQHPKSDRYKPEVFKPFFDEGVEQGTAFLTIDKTSGEIMGSTRYYNFNPEDSSIAIGFTFLATKFWGGKYNLACKTLLLDYAFQYVDKVYFHIGPTNTRSQIATMRIGAEFLRETDTEILGSRTLHREYVITKDSWNKRTTTN
ncbi:MAG: N-acetyltransferase [Bacteroidetes bacterium]|nr:MAG: N-acetyltransferase [Bacteroidota bacterium]